MKKGWVVGIILVLILLGLIWYFNLFGSNNKLAGNCAGAGEVALNEVTGEFKQCCSGLEEIVGVEGPTSDLNCEELLNMEGFSSICSDCGNNVCEEWENICNCPADCS